MIWKKLTAVETDQLLVEAATADRDVKMAKRRSIPPPMPSRVANGSTIRKHLHLTVFSEQEFVKLAIANIDVFENRDC